MKPANAPDTFYRPSRIKTVLVANRGEIAVRVIRAARELGMRAVAVVSDADRDSLAARMADEAIHIGSSHAAKSYLNPAAILDAARQCGADAIHPGYGYLSENAAFAAQVGVGRVTKPATKSERNRPIRPQMTDSVLIRKPL